jgi:LysM repeat protein
MVAEVIADLQLIPQSRAAVGNAGEVADQQYNKSENNKQPKRQLKRFLLAAAALMVLCAAGILGLAGLRALVSHRMDDERSLERKVPQASAPVPVAANANETIATEPAPSTTPFEITVQPNQRLRDISVQYLGGFDLKRLHQIQALNPKLTDPDHIEVGQKIRLPVSPSVPVTRDATLQASARKLP